MKAMVLAAGLGTRLRPLTVDRPKALVRLGGQTLLAIALRRLKAAGVTQVIVNTHHFAELVEAEIQTLERRLDLRIAISREEALLDTGGGLKQAAWFFTDSDEPFLLHNVDILSAIDLGAMLGFHREQENLATLAVQPRASARQLLFDARGLLAGRRTARNGTSADEIARPAPWYEPLAFAGIHVLSPRLLPLLTEEGAFPIVPAYLRLAAAGERIAAYRADQAYWRDLGRPESLAEAEQDIASRRVILD
jgi:NDP-sugar pyrophosphorylase family protein